MAGMGAPYKPHGGAVMEASLLVAVRNDDSMNPSWSLLRSGQSDQPGRGPYSEESQRVST
jgi:hypothetical protein